MKRSSGPLWSVSSEEPDPDLIYDRDDARHDQCQPRLRFTTRARCALKWLLFPGLDLLTRCRYRFLPSFFLEGPVRTLDAGCGNGALSYAAYKRGNKVVGITNDQDQVRKNRHLFASRGVPSSDLCFLQLNLYELPKLGATFDQIVCSETLEHIADDQLILDYFNQALTMGGVLHLCSPFALHPLHALGRVNEPEDGRHVRDGYTLTSYAELLDNAGFEIVESAGLGGPVIVPLYRAMSWIRTKLGDLPAAPLFLIASPLFRLDTLNPPTPFSLYVKGIKRRAINR